MGFKVKFKLLRSSAGSSAESGGGGGDAGATRPPPPQRESLPPSRSPSPPDDEDDEDSEEEEDEHERSGYGSLLLSLKQNIPHYIGRQNCDPLMTWKYFSLSHKWRQLLAGKRTYLRPSKNNEHNYDDFLFQNPEPLPRALGYQEPLLVMVREAAKNPIIQQKFKVKLTGTPHIHQLVPAQEKVTVLPGDGVVDFRR